MLRSIRYGEADRVLHLYTADRGRVGAVAKGVRRVRSRLGRAAGAAQPREPGAPRGPRRAVHDQPGGHGARPFGPARAPHLARARKPGLRGGAAPARLLRAQPPGVQPALQRAGAARRHPPAASRAQALGLPGEAAAGRGVRPRAVGLRGLRRGGAPGRVLARAPAEWSAPAARRGPSRSSEGAHAFLVEALARPLAEAPEAADRALAQADRALAETLEHHAHVRLRRVPRLNSRRLSPGQGTRISPWRPPPHKLVYAFAEGSRDMRDLLGGKGANVAEMTRVLGAERVPAGFTITTEACVAYMRAGRAEPAGARGAGGRGARAPGGGGRASGWATRATRCWCRCARAPASRCPGCSTRCSTSG